MAERSRHTARAFAEMPDEELDQLLSGATRRGELDRLLESAAPETDAGRLIPWPRIAIAAAAAVLLTIGGLLAFGSGGSLGDDLLQLRHAQRSGREPSETLLARVRTAIDDPETTELLLGNPYTESAFEAAARDAGPLRGEVADGIDLRRPGGVITTLDFVLETGLPDDSTWQVELDLRHVESGAERSWTLTQSTGHDGELHFAPPASEVLRSGLWRVTARLAAIHDLDWRPARAEFVMAEPGAAEKLLAELPATGNERLDRQLRAARLLAEGFAVDALSELGTLEDGDATGLLLRVRALTALGDTAELATLRSAWKLAVRSQSER